MNKQTEDKILEMLLHIHVVHMVHGNTYLHMYGPHLHRRTMMMRMLWVMMGMFVPFVAPSLTLKRCPCVTSVNCNIVRIALTHTHVTV